MHGLGCRAYSHLEAAGVVSVVRVDVEHADKEAAEAKRHDNLLPWNLLLVMRRHGVGGL